mgnify:FL=1
MEEFVATGRRKTAVASIRLRPGTGRVDINKKESLDQYFGTPDQCLTALSPLGLLSLDGHFDMIIRVQGGGLYAQAEAIRLGIARALVLRSESDRGDLKAKGFLTRDSRKRERKKYGQPGARKKYQFSKR